MVSHAFLNAPKTLGESFGATFYAQQCPSEDKIPVLEIFKLVPKLWSND